jgi:hypothetical protein
MAEAWWRRTPALMQFHGVCLRQGGLSRLKQSGSAVTARVMKRSAAELQGDQQELIKLLDYKQDEMLLEEVSKLLGMSAFVVAMVRRLGDVLN